MISVQDAVTAVLGYVKQFDKILPSENVRLEEFEFDDTKRTWLITLSFMEASGPISSVLQSGTPAYRTFAVDAETGHVMSMRLRSPSARS
jgi:hypothetical protein